MNLKNEKISEMLNTEFSNTTTKLNTDYSQWNSSLHNQLNTNDSQNKNYLNNFQNTYNYFIESTDPYHHENYLPNSNQIQFQNQNFILLNQENQNSEQLKSEYQFSANCYNNQFYQPIRENEFNNEFQNFGSINNVQHVNTTKNIHHYNISLHSSNLTKEPNQLQVNNNLPLQNSSSLSTSTINLSSNYTLESSTKKKKKDQNCNKELEIKSLNKSLTKNSLKRKNSKIKEETNLCLINGCLSKSLDNSFNDTYNSYDYFSSNDLSDQNNSNYSSSALLDSIFQTIKFNTYMPNTWYNLYDENFNKLSTPYFEVYADKGFNFSNIDDVFICQKKNHFQLTVNIHPLKIETNREEKLKKNNSIKCIYIKLKDKDGNYNFEKVETFLLSFYGVKVESQNQIIRIEQSQSDRSKKPFHPIKINLLNGQISKTTVGRLHFSETTANNMRKKGKPNPDQKYFYLVASLCVTINNLSYPIISHSSERLIVRASNPGQFETDIESCWQKSQFVQNSIFHNGKVGINIDDPEEALVVYGNFKLTGNLIQPSDCRIKKNIKVLDTKSSLSSISDINLYTYNYTEEYEKTFLKEKRNFLEVGVLAQEMIKILPDAVKNCGKLKINENQSIDNFLVINKDRLFMEGIGAIKELNLITKSLKSRLRNIENKISSTKKENYSDKFYKLIEPKSIICVFLFFILVKMNSLQKYTPMDQAKEVSILAKCTRIINSKSFKEKAKFFLIELPSILLGILYSYGSGNIPEHLKFLFDFKIIKSNFMKGTDFKDQNLKSNSILILEVLTKLIRVLTI